MREAEKNQKRMVGKESKISGSERERGSNKKDGRELKGWPGRR